MSEMADKAKRRISAVSLDPSISRSKFATSLSAPEVYCAHDYFKLRQYGFKNFLVDEITAHERVIVYLCQNSYFHMTVLFYSHFSPFRKEILIMPNLR